MDLDTYCRFKVTRSSAIAEGPRVALCQLKSCRLTHNIYEKPHLKWTAMGNGPERYSRYKSLVYTADGECMQTVFTARAIALQALY